MNEKNEFVDTNESQNAPVKKSKQDIFAEQFDFLIKEFDEKCNETGVEIAVAVFVHPEFPDTPMVYHRGQLFDMAELMAKTLRIMKNDIYKALEA